MRLYLAGPMRGIPDNNGPAFAEAAAHLRSLGHEVWSPAEHDEKLMPNDLDGQMLIDVFKRDLAALCDQGGLVLLEGWNRSHGACLECHTADVIHLPVWLYEPRVEGALVPKSTHDWRWRAK